MQPLVIAMRDLAERHASRRHMTSRRTPVENAPPTFLRDKGIDNPRAPRYSHTNEGFFVRLTPLEKMAWDTYRAIVVDDDNDDDDDGESIYPSASVKEALMQSPTDLGERDHEGNGERIGNS